MPRRPPGARYRARPPCPRHPVLQLHEDLLGGQPGNSCVPSLPRGTATWHTRKKEGRGKERSGSGLPFCVLRLHSATKGLPGILRSRVVNPRLSPCDVPGAVARVADPARRKAMKMPVRRTHKAQRPRCLRRGIYTEEHARGLSNACDYVTYSGESWGASAGSRGIDRAPLDVRCT